VFLPRILPPARVPLPSPPLSPPPRPRSKYKPLTQPRKCTSCSQKTIQLAYHTLCQPCSKKKDKCAKCGAAKDTVASVATRLADVEAQIEEIADFKGQIPGVPERERRTMLRNLLKERAVLLHGEKNKGVDGEEEAAGAEAADDGADGEGEGGEEREAAGQEAPAGEDGEDEEEENEEDDDDEEEEEEDEDEDEDDDGDGDEDEEDEEEATPAAAAAADRIKRGVKGAGEGGLGALLRATAASNAKAGTGAAPSSSVPSSSLYEDALDDKADFFAKALADAKRKEALLLGVEPAAAAAPGKGGAGKR
jgi:hypothetical protein